MKKHFYIEDYYILTKNDDNWDAVKWMLGLPIWERTNKKSSSDYKEYKRIRREIQNKKGLTKKQKKEFIKKLDEEKAKTMDEIITPTHRTFLRAFGDLICERGDPPSISAPAIENRFMELVIEEYDKYVEKQIKIILKQIEQSKGKEENKKKLRNIKIKKVKERIKKLKKEHLNKVKQMNEGRGLKTVNKINSLNNWLNKNHLGLFIKKVGENYKILVYYAEGRGDLEYFCSDKNKDKFIDLINKRKEEILKLKEKFNSITAIKDFENDLNAPFKEDEYFRRGGPVKYHLEHKLMFKRKKVSEIENDFTKKVNPKNIQLLKGDAASGKTVIARFVGYEFLSDGWNVYRISIEELDENKVDDIIFSLNYLEETSNKSFVVIEDLHKKNMVSASLVEGLTKINRKTLFLLTTRYSLDVNLTDYEKSIFERCELKELTEKDFESDVDLIIRNYINNQRSERKEVFLKKFPQYREKIIEESKGNLWILAYFLDAWIPNKGINIEIVYDKIKKDIKDLEKEFKTKHKLRGVAQALLNIAPLSVFEIPVSKHFIQGKSESQEFDFFTYDKLIEYGMTTEINGHYLIPHSTLAILYMETYLFLNGGKKPSDLLYGIFKNQNATGPSGKIDEYPIKKLHKYIQWKPKNFGTILQNIYNFETWENVDEKRAIWPWERIRNRGEYYWYYRIISCLLENKKTLNALKKLMKDSENLQEINSLLLSGWSRFDNRYKNELLEICAGIGEHNWIRRIENSHGVEIIDFLDIMFKLSFIEEKYHFLRSLFNKQNIPIIKTKLKECPPLKVKRFIELIYWIDESLSSYFEDMIPEKIKTVDFT